MPQDLGTYLASQMMTLATHLQAGNITFIEPPLAGLLAGGKGWRRAFKVEVILDPVPVLKRGDTVLIFDQPGAVATDLPKQLAQLVTEIWAPSLEEVGAYAVVKSRRRPTGGRHRLPARGPLGQALARAQQDRIDALIWGVGKIEEAVWAEDAVAFNAAAEDMQRQLAGRVPGEVTVHASADWVVGLELTPPLAVEMLLSSLVQVVDLIVESGDEGRLIKTTPNDQQLLRRKPASPETDMWALLRKRRK